MKRIILKPEFSLRLLERKRVWMGLAAGLFLAFSFYLFGLYLNEAVRVFIKDRVFGYGQIDPGIGYLLRFFVAFVSMIFGSVAMFEVWFNKPKFAFKKRIDRNPRIYAEARAIIWYFIFWCTSVTIFPLFYFINIDFHYCFGFISDFAYIFILLMVVLYVSLWTGFIRSFKSAWKPQLIHLFVTILFSGLLAFYVPAKIRSINEAKRDRLITNRFTMDIPNAVVYDSDHLEKISLVFDVFVVRPRGSDNEKTIFLIDNIEYPENELEQKFQLELDAHDYSERRFIVARLFVDSEITMETIHNLKSKLKDVGIYQAYFVMKKTKDYCNQPGIGEYGIGIKLFPKIKGPGDNLVKSGYDRPKPLPLKSDFYKFFKSKVENDSLLIINMNSDRKFSLNSGPGNLDQLESALEEKWKPGFRIILGSEDDVKYKDYIRALAQMDNFVFAKRNQFSQKSFNTDYRDIYDRSKIKKVRKNVPYFFVFDPGEMKIILEP